MEPDSYMIRIPKTSARLATIVLATALTVAPLTALATHSFTDVADSNTFHDDIAWLADAGVTKGCNPPHNTRFCPDDNVTRGQMAAFMNRFAGYIGATDGTPAQADNATTADNADTVDGEHASAFVRRSELPTQGGTSCAGVGFLPNSSSYDWNGDYRTTTSSAASFECAVSMPHGATITRLTAGIEDTTSSSATCLLIRVDVTGGRLGVGAGDADILAQTNPTTGSSGDQTIGTTDIDFPEVDNRRYAYWVRCEIGAGLRINGVVVQYELS